MHSPTRVVFVQHPRESRVPISTCRMAHLSLPNSEMHVALGGEDLALADDAAVLFPSDDAVDVAKLDKPPSTLVVVDGTWSNARKVVERSPRLRALPRISLNPDRPGNYRIRKEPKPNCLSTIEAVALVLGHLEGEPLKFQPILSVFDRMVETQLGHIGEGPSRHRRLRDRNTRRRDVTKPLRDAWANLVLAYGEANGWPAEANIPGKAELIQLVALRPSSGERFEVLLKPRRPLAPRAAFHLDVPPQTLLDGLEVSEALERWRAFSRPDDVVATWGPFTLDLLTDAGAPVARTLNLKHIASQLVFRSMGGLERAAGDGALIEGKGRAARRLHALELVARRLASP
jgi:DTW domain-containing protein YfiP